MHEYIGQLDAQFTLYLFSGLLVVTLILTILYLRSRKKAYNEREEKARGQAQKRLKATTGMTNPQNAASMVPSRFLSEDYEVPEPSSEEVLDEPKEVTPTKLSLIESLALNKIRSGEWDLNFESNDKGNVVIFGVKGVLKITTAKPEGEGEIAEVPDMETNPMETLEPSRTPTPTATPEGEPENRRKRKVLPIEETGEY